MKGLADIRNTASLVDKYTVWPSSGLLASPVVWTGLTRCDPVGSGTLCRGGAAAWAERRPAAQRKVNESDRIAFYSCAIL